MWQPIETAPTEDWAQFLVFGKDGVFHTALEKGLYWSLSYVDAMPASELKLTHWMPLPEPPSDN